MPVTSSTPFVLHLPANCQHDCVNTWGSYYCTCRQGYRLEADGKTCRGKYTDHGLLHYPSISTDSLSYAEQSKTNKTWFHGQSLLHKHHYENNVCGSLYLTLHQNYKTRTHCIVRHQEGMGEVGKYGDVLFRFFPWHYCTSDVAFIRLKDTSKQK